MTPKDNIIVPPPLREGDRIAILSPSGIVKPQNVYGAVGILQDLGWEPYVAEHALSRHGTYAGTDEQRYADLERAILDPDTRAIMCSRGGYGAVHLLERLNRLPLRDNAKWIIGFSDISALHALMSAHGIQSIHGHMTSHLTSSGGTDDDSLALFDILRGEHVGYDFPAHQYNRTGQAVGKLLGGNLAVIAGLIGTPYDVIEPGTILFMEDVSEPVYKIERIMYQLRLSGVLERLAGLVVGRFTEYSPDVDNASMEAMIHTMVSDYAYPVAFNAPIGHVSHNIPLTVSAQATLTVTDSVVTLEQ
ncbi:MAG: LD-carboxypeptidase [Muribaculaceae bacterium]|nr:LD-carboxypeptidase [Muribaculaceae bacterium]